MSSTTGLKSGSLLNELARQKRVTKKAVKRAYQQRKRAEMWRQRALAAEYMLLAQRTRRNAYAKKAA